MRVLLDWRNGEGLFRMAAKVAVNELIRQALKQVPVSLFPSFLNVVKIKKKLLYILDFLKYTTLNLRFFCI